MKRYYYKHISNGGLMNLKSPLDDPEYLPISEEEYNELTQAHEEEPINHEVLTAIMELKTKLAETDYQAIKYAEGWLSEEEFAPIKEYRQSLRDQINLLQGN